MGPGNLALRVVGVLALANVSGTEFHGWWVRPETERASGIYLKPRGRGFSFSSCGRWPSRLVGIEKAPPPASRDGADGTRVASFAIMGTYCYAELTAVQKIALTAIVDQAHNSN
jgi:hypothetical protein